MPPGPPSPRQSLSIQGVFLLSKKGKSHSQSSLRIPNIAANATNAMIHGERVLISLFGSMGFVVWVVTQLWLAQMGGDEEGGRKGMKNKERGKGK